MKFEDVVEITQNAVAQAMGAKYMEKTGEFKALDTAKLVDVGKDVLDSGSVETYTKALISQLGKLSIDSRDYDTDLPSIMVESFEWGGYLERVYFAPTDIIEDPSYNLTKGKSYSDIEHTFYQPNVSAKIYEEAKAIMAPISIQRDQLQQSFNGWDQLNSFLSGVYRSVRNTINFALKVYSHMLVSAAIAVSVKGTKTAVHLLTNYNALKGTELTRDQAKDDKDFLIYALKEMNLTQSRMRDWSTAYNNKSIPVFTPRSSSRAILLNDFVTNVKFDVYPVVYDRESIGLGDFDTVNSWQGILESDSYYSFDTVSKINISADETNKLGIGTEAFEQTGIIGLIYDEMAIGVCLHKSKITSSYTASADFWTEFHKELLNYLLDSNYSMVAFVID